MVSFVEPIYVPITSVRAKATHGFMKELLHTSFVKAVDIEIWDTFVLGEHNYRKQTEK